MEPLVNELLRQSPVAIVLGLGLYFFYAGKIRTETDYSELKADRDWWRDVALRVTDFADTTTRVLEQRKQPNRTTGHSESRGSGDGHS